MYVLSEFDVFNVTQRLIIKKKCHSRSPGLYYIYIYIYDE